LLCFCFAPSASAATNVYYSVGQNANDHSSGGNVSITSGVATFAVAQAAANLGVGDRLTAGGNVYYLATKTDTTHWNVVTALGAVPADLGLTAVTSIAHEYTSLSAAEAGASDSNHLNTSDLVTGNYQLNFPCYYDTGPDTSYVAISGWTTGPDNYMRVYTPYYLATEVNQSQRHTGKWEANKYYLEPGTDEQAFQIYTPYTVVDGLQITIYGSSSSPRICILAGENNGLGSYLTIENNILKGKASVGTTYGIYFIEYGPYKIYNNIIYDFTSANSIGIYGFTQDSAKAYLYNNTINDCTRGFYADGSDVLVVKNNIVQGSTDGFAGYAYAFGSDNNLSNVATDAPSPSYRSNLATTVSFTDPANGDFHLAPSDSGARDHGADLSSDPNLPFNHDIDGDERSGDWDIGADEWHGIILQATQTDKATANLVGMWSFDGPDVNMATNTAIDRSTGGHNGTISGATQAIGKRGAALAFNGTSSQVTVGNTGQSIGSVSFWVKPATTSQYLMDLDGGSHYIRLNAGTVTAFGFDTPTIYVDGVATTTVSNTDWHHITVTTATPIAASNITIGKVSSNYFAGTLDEVRIYTGVLSADQALTLANLGQIQINSSQTDKLTQGLVGMWSFDGPDIRGVGVGSSAVDRSGHGNDGLISGATPTIGKHGSALRFDGSSSYIYINNNANTFLNMARGNISLWYKSQGAGSTASPRLVSFDASGDSLELTFYNNDSLLIQHQGDWNGYDSILISVPDIQTDENWHFVSANWDVDGIGGGANTLSVNFDGTNSAESVVLFNPTAFGGNINLGRNAYDDDYFNGAIDEARIYDRALSDEEMGDLYHMGQARISR
jgi:hypothetical protein